MKDNVEAFHVNMLMVSAAITSDEKDRIRRSIANRTSMIEEEGNASSSKKTEQDFLMVDYMANNFDSSAPGSPNNRLNQEQSRGSLASN